MAEKLKAQRAVLATWKTTRVYPSDGTVKCAGYNCHKVILQGEYFSRHKPAVAPYHHSIHAFCKTCVPFTIVTNTTEDVYDATLEKYMQTFMYVQDDLSWQQNYGV